MKKKKAGCIWQTITKNSQRIKYYSSQIIAASDWWQSDKERNKNLVIKPLHGKINKTEISMKLRRPQMQKVA